MYWVRLPQDLCYTFYFDGSHPNAFPDTIGLFDDLTDLDDYKWLQASLLSKGINSVLTAEVPITRDAKARSDATVILLIQFLVIRISLKVTFLEIYWVSLRHLMISNYIP